MCDNKLTLGCVYHVSENVLHLGRKIRHFAPPELKQLSSLIIFKKTIRNWIQEKCPCRLCNVYLDGIGYLELKF